jgi:hypothetical protein
MDIKDALAILADPEASYRRLKETGADETAIREVFATAQATQELYKEAERRLQQREAAEIEAYNQLPSWLQDFQALPERGSQKDGMYSWFLALAAVSCVVVGAAIPRTNPVRPVILGIGVMYGALGVIKADDFSSWEERTAPALEAQNTLRTIAYESQLADLIGVDVEQGGGVAGEVDAVSQQEALPATRQGEELPRNLTEEGLTLFPADEVNPTATLPSPQPTQPRGYAPPPSPSFAATKATTASFVPFVEDLFLQSSVKPTLIVGGQGSGKACTAISIVTALGKANPKGVQVLAYDNSEGGHNDQYSIWTRTGVPSLSCPFEFADLVTSVVDNLKRRPQRNNRDEYESHPWLVLIIDELSTATDSYDKDELEAVKKAIKTLFTQGAKRKVVLLFLNQNPSIGGAAGIFSKSDRSNFTIVALNEQVANCVEQNGLGLKVSKDRSFGRYLRDNTGKYQAAFISSVAGELTALPASHSTHHGVAISTNPDIQAKPSKWAEAPNLAAPPDWLPTSVKPHYDFFYANGKPETFGEPVASRTEQVELPKDSDDDVNLGDGVSLKKEAYSAIRADTLTRLEGGESPDSIMESWGVDLTSARILWEAITR